MILNVYKAELQLNPTLNLTEIMERTCFSTGINKSSVYRVINEYKEFKVLSSPKKTRPRNSLLDSIDDFDRNAIRREVHQFFFRNEIPTIDKVLANVNANPDLPNFKRTTFHQLLKQLNFQYVRRQRDSMLIDKEEIIVWRRNYLRKLRTARIEGKKIYYLDETWLNE